MPPAQLQMSRILAPDNDQTSDWSILASSRFRTRPMINVLDLEILSAFWESYDDSQNLFSSSLFFVESSAFSFSSCCSFSSRFRFSDWWFSDCIHNISVSPFIAVTSFWISVFVDLTSRARCRQSRHGHTPNSSGGNATHFRWYYLAHKQHPTISRSAARPWTSQSSIQWRSANTGFSGGGVVPDVCELWFPSWSSSSPDPGRASSAGSFVTSTVRSLLLRSCHWARSWFLSHESHIVRLFDRAFTLFFFTLFTNFVYGWHVGMEHIELPNTFTWPGLAQGLNVCHASYNGEARVHGWRDSISPPNPQSWHKTTGNCQRGLDKITTKLAVSCHCIFNSPWV